MRITDLAVVLMKEHLKKTCTDEGLDDLVECAHRDMFGLIEDDELRFRVAKLLGRQSGDGPGLPDA